MSNGTPRPTKLLVCEGIEDKFFYERLISIHLLPPFFIIDAGGNGEFAEALNSFRVERTREFNDLRDIIIVADNDEDPAGRFANVRTQIDRVFGPGVAPTAPLERTTRTASRPQSVTVLMIPWVGENGHLERLCVDAARDANRTAANHVDMFMDLVNAEKWNSESRWGKAWLRSNLAVRCARDPFIALGHVFHEARYQSLVPVNHNSFKRIVDFLRAL